VYTALAIAIGIAVPTIFAIWWWWIMVEKAITLRNMDWRDVIGLTFFSSLFTIGTCFSIFLVVFIPFAGIMALVHLASLDHPKPPAPVVLERSE